MAGVPPGWHSRRMNDGTDHTRPAAPARFKDLCVDANDHQWLADWWCAAIGYRRRDELHPPEDAPEGWSRPAEWPVPIVDPAGEGPAIWINPVPEPKTVKNRLHLDVIGDSAALQAAGATLLHRFTEEGTTWDVLADPEGNEFCVLSSRKPG